jgi:kumamolisin
MADEEAKVPVGGSEREPASGAEVIGDVPAGEQIEVTIVVRRRPGAVLHGPDAQGAQPSVERLSREEFAARDGADPADIKAVEDFAKAAGFTITEVHQAARTIRIRGTAAQFQQAFQVSLKRYDSDLGPYRGRVGAVHVPSSIAPLVEAVLGLDDRPQASSHM